MPEIYNYIKENITLNITDFTYIKVIDEKLVYYETKNEIIFLKEVLKMENHEITLKDFLHFSKSLLGLQGNLFTYVSKGENIFDEFNQNVRNKKGEIFSVVEFAEGYNDIRDPIDFLAHHMKFHDLFIADLSSYAILNYKDFFLTFEKIDILDEFFKKPKLIRMYKHYSEFYIFF